MQMEMEHVLSGSCTVGLNKVYAIASRSIFCRFCQTHSRVHDSRGVGLIEFDNI